MFYLNSFIIITISIQFLSPKNNKSKDLENIFDQYSLNMLLDENNIIENEQENSSLKLVKDDKKNSMKCSIQISITLSEFRLHKSKSKGNSYTVSKIEIKEKMLNHTNIIIKTNLDTKIIKLEMKNLENKDLEDFKKGKYSFKTKLKGIYWKIYDNIIYTHQGNLKKATSNDFSDSAFEDDDQSYKNFSMLNDLKKTDENLGSFYRRLIDVPCDVNIDNLKIVAGKVIEDKREVNEKSFGCFSVKKIEDVVNMAFDFEVNFLNKDHLDYSGNEFESILEKRGEKFGKFKSYEDFKNNLEHLYNN